MIKSYPGRKSSECQQCNIVKIKLFIAKLKKKRKRINLSGIELKPQYDNKDQKLLVQ